mgnify:CR=1 FL=1
MADNPHSIVVIDEARLEGWIAAVLEHGGGWSDAVLLSAAHRAVLAGDDQALDRVAERRRFAAYQARYGVPSEL